MRVISACAAIQNQEGKFCFHVFQRQHLQRALGSIFQQGFARPRLFCKHKPHRSHSYPVHLGLWYRVLLMKEVEGSLWSMSTNVWYSTSYLPFIFLKGFYATLIKQCKGNIEFKHCWMTEKINSSRISFFNDLYWFSFHHGLDAFLQHYFKNLLHSSFNKDKPSAFKSFCKFLKFARLCSKPNGFSWSFLFYQQ